MSKKDKLNKKEGAKITSENNGTEVSNFNKDIKAMPKGNQESPGIKGEKFLVTINKDIFGRPTNETQEPKIFELISRKEVEQGIIILTHGWNIEDKGVIIKTNTIKENMMTEALVFVEGYKAESGTLIKIEHKAK